MYFWLLLQIYPSDLSHYMTLGGLQTVLKADNVCPHCTVQIECVTNTDFVLFIAWLLNSQCSSCGQSVASACTCIMELRRHCECCLNALRPRTLPTHELKYRAPACLGLEEGLWGWFEFTCYCLHGCSVLWRVLMVSWQCLKIAGFQGFACGEGRLLRRVWNYKKRLITALNFY